MRLLYARDCDRPSNHPMSCIPTSRKKVPDQPGNPSQARRSHPLVRRRLSRVDIDVEGIGARISEVQVPAGNYRALTATEKRLCWLDENPSKPDEAPLQCLDIANKGE